MAQSTQLTHRMAHPMQYAAALLFMLLATLITTQMSVAHASELVPTANIAGDSAMAIATETGTVASIAGLAGDSAASLVAGTETLGYLCLTYSPYGGCNPYYLNGYQYPYMSWYYPYGYYPYSYYPYSYVGYYAPYWANYSWPYSAWYW